MDTTSADISTNLHQGGGVVFMLPLLLVLRLQVITVQRDHNVYNLRANIQIRDTEKAFVR